MTYNEFITWLEALDASIKTWKRRVHVLMGSPEFWDEDCALCDLDGKIWDYRGSVYTLCQECPVKTSTYYGCSGTSFNDVEVDTPKAANRMLSELYEVRRQFIAKYNKGEL